MTPKVNFNLTNLWERFIICSITADAVLYTGRVQLLPSSALPRAAVQSCERNLRGPGESRNSTPTPVPGPELPSVLSTSGMTRQTLKLIGGPLPNVSQKDKKAERGFSLCPLMGREHFARQLAGAFVPSHRSALLGSSQAIVYRSSASEVGSHVCKVALPREVRSPTNIDVEG